MPKDDVKKQSSAMRYLKIMAFVDELGLHSKFFIIS